MNQINLTKLKNKYAIPFLIRINLKTLILCTSVSNYLKFNHEPSFESRNINFVSGVLDFALKVFTFKAVNSIHIHFLITQKNVISWFPQYIIYTQQNCSKCSPSLLYFQYEISTWICFVNGVTDFHLIFKLFRTMHKL